MRFLPFIVLLLLVGCPAPEKASSDTAATDAETVRAEAQPVRVWADNNLAMALDVLDELFVEQYLPCYDVTYWDTAELTNRLKDNDQPLTADLVLSGSPADLEYLLVNEKVEEAAVRTFAGDKLTIIKRPGETWTASSLFDIYPLYFQLLGYSEEHTESGRLAQQALISCGVMPRVEDRLTRLDSEAAVIEALLADQVQLGIVLKSTASQHHEVELMLEIAEDLHEDIRYRAFVVKDKLTQPGVNELLSFLAEDMQVQLNLEALGYQRRAVAMQED